MSPPFTTGIDRAGLSGFSLKFIAIVAMTIDHVGAVFFPTAYILRFIGRLTLPIMAFLISEGYFHTRNKKKYFFRLLLFGLISQFPFSMAFSTSSGNIMFTLALSVLDSQKFRFFKIPVVCCLIFLTCFCDWPIFGILYVIFFNRYRGDFRMQCVAFSLISIAMMLVFASSYLMHPAGLYHLGVFMALPILSLYNGERGHDSRWLFYLFYPLHLLAISVFVYLL